jgi:hypothetical protein
VMTHTRPRPRHLRLFGASARSIRAEGEENCEPQKPCERPDYFSRHVLTGCNQHALGWQCESRCTMRTRLDLIRILLGVVNCAATRWTFAGHSSTQYSRTKPC